MVPALDNMMRAAGRNDSGHAGHVASLAFEGGV